MTPEKLVVIPINLSSGWVWTIMRGCYGDDNIPILPFEFASRRNYSSYDQAHKAAQRLVKKHGLPLVNPPIARNTAIHEASHAAMAMWVWFTCASSNHPWPNNKPFIVLDERKPMAYINFTRLDSRYREAQI